MKQNLVD